MHGVVSLPEAPSYDNVFYSFHACVFYHVLIAFANSLDPVHDQQSVGPDPNHMIVFLRNYFNVNFGRVSRQQQKHVKLFYKPYMPA